MSQTYTVRINRKDLYKKNYNKKVCEDKCKKNLVVKKSLIDLFIRILEEGA